MISKKYPVSLAPARQWSSGLALVICLAAGGNALAYKVERVCETSEPTVKKPANQNLQDLAGQG